MPRRCVIRSALACWFCSSVAFFCSPLVAADRDLRIEELYHSAWTVKDGLPGNIQALAQTADGFLWLGTAGGLFRFDGVRFQRFAPQEGEAFESESIYSLLAVPDGGLWIGYGRGGIGLLKGGNLTNYGKKEGISLNNIYSIVTDQDGTTWATAGPDGLYRFDGAHWRSVQADWNLGTDAWGARVDDSGRLWIGTLHGVYFLPKGEKKFHLLTTSPLVTFAAITPDYVWAGEMSGVLHLVPTACQATACESNTLMHDPPSPLKTATTDVTDRLGNLWIGTWQDGIYRIPHSEFSAPTPMSVENFTEKDKLTNNRIVRMIEDREGNIWVATKKGLDSFRASAIVSVPLPRGLSNFTLMPMEQGAMRVTAQYSGSFQIKDGKASGLEPDHLGISSTYRDPKGDIWLGSTGDNNIRRLANDKMTTLAAPGFTGSMTMDAAGRLWALVVTKGFWRLENGQWTNFPNLGHGAASFFTDSTGKVWVGFNNGDVMTLTGDTSKTFTDKESPRIGAVTVIQGLKNHVWFGGEKGLSVLMANRFIPVVPSDAPSFTHISGIVATRDNGLWFGESRGIGHIEASELETLERDPTHLVNYRIFDSEDGLLAPLQPYFPTPSAALGSDGTIWFATADGVVSIDPKRIPSNPLPPPVVIESLTANGKSYDPKESPTLPAGTKNLEVIYTATSLSIPARVRFRYRLEGLDNNWQDAGTVRKAVYTNLDPGNYRFHLMACNNDGVWNENGATIRFRIAPSWYQTSWFLIICALLALLILALLYRLRTRQLARSLSIRFNERLAERTRLARDLHDTLLQSVQALILRVHAASRQLADRLPPKDPAIHILDKALAQAEEAMSEGRDRVQGLRASAAVLNDLPQALTAVGEDLALVHAIIFKSIIEGTPRSLKPEVSEEAYLIGREALLNAFRHSQAKTIELQCIFAAEGLQWRIRDDGVGMDSTVGNSSRRPGHWGLTGMRERAEKIGGKLDIWSRAGAGTEIEFTISASLAYQRDAFLGSWAILRKRIEQLLQMRRQGANK